MNEQTRARICIASIVLCRSHLLMRHDWSIIYTIPAYYWSNYFGCFRQYKNPAQDVTHINDTYGHPKYKASKKCWASLNQRCLMLFNVHDNLCCPSKKKIKKSQGVLLMYIRCSKCSLYTYIQANQTFANYAQYTYCRMVVCYSEHAQTYTWPAVGGQGLTGEWEVFICWWKSRGLEHRLHVETPLHGFQLRHFVVVFFLTLI